MNHDCDGCRRDERCASSCPTMMAALLVVGVMRRAGLKVDPRPVDELEIFGRAPGGCGGAGKTE